MAQTWNWIFYHYVPMGFFVVVHRADTPIPEAGGGSVCSVSIVGELSRDSELHYLEDESKQRNQQSIRTNRDRTAT